MTYQGEGLHHLPNNVAVHRLGERHQSTEDGYPSRDRRPRLYCLVGFTVTSILAWLFIVLFARHTAIEIALLIMTCAGVGGAMAVAGIGLCRRLQTNRRNWGK